MKAFKAPQRSVNLKFNLNFSLGQGLGREGLRCLLYSGTNPEPIAIFLLLVESFYINE